MCVSERWFVTEYWDIKCSQKQIKTICRVSMANAIEITCCGIGGMKSCDISFTGRVWFVCSQSLSTVGEVHIGEECLLTLGLVCPLMVCTMMLNVVYLKISLQSMHVYSIVSWTCSDSRHWYVILYFSFLSFGLNWIQRYGRVVEQQGILQSK